MLVSALSSWVIPFAENKKYICNCDSMYSSSPIKSSFINSLLHFAFPAWQYILRITPYHFIESISNLAYKCLLGKKYLGWKNIECDYWNITELLDADKAMLGGKLQLHMLILEEKWGWEMAQSIKRSHHTHVRNHRIPCTHVKARWQPSCNNSAREVDIDGRGKLASWIGML